jgi:magnesium chelatase family protein
VRQPMDLRHGFWRGDHQPRFWLVDIPGQLHAGGRDARSACPCGWYGDPIKPCTCSPATISRYQHKISGPLLDRIDTPFGRLEVSRVDYEKLSDARSGEPTAAIRGRARSAAARNRQALRFKGTSLTCNADMGVGDVRVHCVLDALICCRCS